VLSTLRKHALAARKETGLATAYACRQAVRAHNWSGRHQKGLKIAFAVGVSIGFALDLLIVLVFHRTSISATTWELEEQHETLIVLVNLIWLVIGYLVRSDWRFVGLALWLGGHLGGHW
jgi:hypothetical protein